VQFDLATDLKGKFDEYLPWVITAIFLPVPFFRLVVFLTFGEYFLGQGDQTLGRFFDKLINY